MKNEKDGAPLDPVTEQIRNSLLKSLKLGKLVNTPRVMEVEKKTTPRPVYAPSPRLSNSPRSITPTSTPSPKLRAGEKSPQTETIERVFDAYDFDYDDEQLSPDAKNVESPRMFPASPRNKRPTSADLRLKLPRAQSAASIQSGPATEEDLVINTERLMTPEHEKLRERPKSARTVQRSPRYDSSARLERIKPRTKEISSPLPDTWTWVNPDDSESDEEPATPIPKPKLVERKLKPKVPPIALPMSETLRVEPEPVIVAPPKIVETAVQTPEKKKDVPPTKKTPPRSASPPFTYKWPSHPIRNEQAQEYDKASLGISDIHLSKNEMQSVFIAGQTSLEELKDLNDTAVQETLVARNVKIGKKLPIVYRKQNSLPGVSIGMWTPQRKL